MSEENPVFGSEAWVKKMEDKYANRTPEEKRADELRRERDAANDHARQVDSLRSETCAPRRHLACAIDRSGEWGEKLSALEKKIGTGFTVALVGVRGNGKTQMAVELMKDATNKLRSAKFCTSTQFFMKIKASYHRESEDTEAEVIGEYRTPKLLVIDEIGKRSDSNWENTLLFELLNRRYNDMTDTLLIDNRPKSDFVAAIGPSLASRMAESGGIIECNWESFR